MRPSLGTLALLLLACEVRNPAFDGIAAPFAGGGTTAPAAGGATIGASGGAAPSGGAAGTANTGGVSGAGGLSGAGGDPASGGNGIAGAGGGPVAGTGGAAGAGGVAIAVPPGLVAQYRFEEGVGATKVVDAAGVVADDATLLQTNEYTGYQASRTTAAGESFWLNDWPTMPYFTAPASADLNSVRTAVTVMAWVKMGGSGWRVIAERPRGNGPNWGLYVTWQDAVEFDAGSVPYYFLAGPRNRVPVGRWKHLAASYDTATGIAKVYVDGRLDGTLVAFDYGTKFPFDPGPGGNNEPFLIGKTSCPDCSRSMTGAIDDLRVYNVALSDAEIAAIAAGN